MPEKKHRSTTSQKKQPVVKKTISKQPAKPKPTTKRKKPLRRPKKPAPKKVTSAKPSVGAKTIQPITENNFPPATLTYQKTPTSYWSWLIGFTIVALALLIVSGLISIFSFSNNFKKNSPLAPTPPVQDSLLQPALTALAPLTGLKTDEVSARRRPWAIIIENFPTVRPQSGLSFADVVIESPTEGGITRFAAIFQSQLPTGQIGPIRSARSYFNDWLRPLAPFFSHSGGSTKALQQLAKGYGDIQDVNEFYNGSAYQRNNSLNAPHNLFTTAEKFFSYVQQKNWPSQQNIQPLNFSTNYQPGQPANQIMIPYQPEEYTVTYQYLPESKVYQRSLMGVKQTDASNNQPILVTNAIVLATDIDPIPNDELKRTELRTLGTGTAWLFTNGQIYKGQWRKDKPDSYLEFVDSSGQPLPLQPGNTWISVIDNSLLKDIKIDSLLPSLES
ncbi:DUF3048 domain-containing protein [Patescibacteria group bacterium]|nr:DUF3048 domain-containing protein [Patescibacteria group bacterium]